MTKEMRKITENIRKIACRCGVNVHELDRSYKNIKESVKLENTERALRSMDDLKETLEGIEQNCGINTKPRRTKIDSFMEDIKSENWTRMNEKVDELYLDVLHTINYCGYEEEGKEL